MNLEREDNKLAIFRENDLYCKRAYRQYFNGFQLVWNGRTEKFRLDSVPPFLKTEDGFIVLVDMAAHSPSNRSAYSVVFVRRKVESQRPKNFR
jgi:hypothetical protein